MAVNPLMRSSPTRLMGLSSGMDTESIIQATLRMHQFKIDNQMRNKTLIEWKQKMHNDIKDQISTLRGTFLQTQASKSLMNRSAFNTNVASLSTLSGKNVSALSVTASVNSSIGNLNVVAVSSLAKGTSIKSTGSVSADKSGFSSSQTLKSLEFNSGAGAISFSRPNELLAAASTTGKAVHVTQETVNEAEWANTYQQGEITLGNGDKVVITKTPKTDGSGDAYSYSVNGKAATGFAEDEENPGTVTFNLSDGGKFTFNTINGQYSASKVEVEVDEFENETETTVYSETGTASYTQYQKATVTATDGSSVVLTRVAGDDSTIKNNNKALAEVGEATLTITHNAKNYVVELTDDMTVSQMIDAVNKEIGDVATMKYDRLSDSFSIETKKTGTDGGTLSISGTGNITEMLFKNTAATINGVVGTKAEMVIKNADGSTDTITQDTNSFTFRGLTINLNHTFVAEEDEDNIIINVKRDVEKPLEAITEFVNGYNTLIKKLEDLLNERKKGSEVSYKPLTDEEKSAMTEKQIEEWESIAKKGLLRSDKGIQDMVNKLRASFFQEIEGMGVSASQIGLSTGNYFGGTGGQIIINEDKLKAALEEDPDRVADIFIKIGEDANGKAEGKGLLYKIDTILNDFVKTNGAQFHTLESLERSLKEANERLAKMEERMWAEEDKLYRQFAAMETALSKMQSQGDWFSAMLGG